MSADDPRYKAMLSRDRRFDGIFFVGVSSTRIYCRPVCTAKKPQSQNCTFYPSAAAAEQAGYRPCLLCRPELAPGQSRVDATGRLAAAAARRIEAGALTEQSVGELARSLEVSDRHLRRTFQQSFGVSPIQLAQTQRLLLAKQLLTSSHLKIADIAFASGFSSVRRLNALFQKRYRLKPSALRKAKAKPSEDSLCCELSYRPPFRWHDLISFLQARACTGVEIVEASSYARTVSIGKHKGWIRVSPMLNKHKLRVEISTSLVATILPILSRVKLLFDLDAEPMLITAHLSSQLGALAAPYAGLRVPGAFNKFEVVVRAILGQQVSVKAATTLMARLIAAAGTPVETPITGLTHLSPTSEQVASLSVDELSELGILPARAKAIRAIAQSISSGTLSLTAHNELDTTVAHLKTFPGIGDWTAHYVAMRVLSYPDAFPHSDLWLCRALNIERPAELLKVAEAWRPWRSYAAMCLWKSLEVAE